LAVNLGLLRLSVPELAWGWCFANAWFSGAAAMVGEAEAEQ
jgi:hypothetical protein